MSHDFCRTCTCHVTSLGWLCPVVGFGAARPFCVRDWAAAESVVNGFPREWVRQKATIFLFPTVPHTCVAVEIQVSRLCPLGAKCTRRWRCSSAVSRPIRTGLGAFKSDCLWLSDGTLHVPVGGDMNFPTWPAQRKVHENVVL